MSVALWQHKETKETRISSHESAPCVHSWERPDWQKIEWMYEDEIPYNHPEYEKWLKSSALVDGNENMRIGPRI